MSGTGHSCAVVGQDDLPGIQSETLDRIVRYQQVRRFIGIQFRHFLAEQGPE